MKRTLLSAITIVVLGLLAGVGANAVRGRDSINLRRNYFSIAPTRGSDETPTPRHEADDPTAEDPKHPFKTVSVGEMIDWFQSQEYASGQVVFVDARNDETYEEGHIPGAFQVDNYNFDRDFTLFRDDIDPADIIVVYCGGGECSDSIYVATELEGMGIARSRIRVFEGGINAWLEDDLPVDEGRE